MAVGDHYFIDGSKLYDVIQKPFTGCQSLKIEGFKDENSDITFTPFNLPIRSDYKPYYDINWLFLDLPFKHGNTTYRATKKFCKATAVNFYTLQGPSPDYQQKIERYDDKLVIGSTEFPASSFRDGIVPKIITIEFCGGGGGGGGAGGADSGCGGGGSGTVIVTLSLDSFSYPSLGRIYIGAGGAGGYGGVDADHNGKDGKDSAIYGFREGDEIDADAGTGGSQSSPGYHLNSYVRESAMVLNYLIKDFMIDWNGGRGGSAKSSGDGTTSYSFDLTNNQVEKNSGIFTVSTSAKSGGSGKYGGGGGASALGNGGKGGDAYESGGSGGYGGGGGGGAFAWLDGKNGGAGGPGFAYFYY